MAFGRALSFCLFCPLLYPIIIVSLNSYIIFYQYVNNKKWKIYPHYMYSKPNELQYYSNKLNGKLYNFIWSNIKYWINNYKFISNII